MNNLMEIHIKKQSTSISIGVSDFSPANISRIKKSRRRKKYRKLLCNDIAMICYNVLFLEKNDYICV